MNKYSEMKVLLESLQDDAEKFYVKGRNVSGTRLRKGMVALKNLAQDIRNEVTEIKKAK